MRRIVVLALISAVAVLGSPGLAGAELVAPVSMLARDYAWPIVAAPDERALAIMPASCDDCGAGRVAERDVSGHWMLRTITPPGMFPIYLAGGPRGAATVLAIAIANTGTGGADAFVLRRPAGAAQFGEPVPVALGGAIYENVQTASDARGDIAFITGVKRPDSVVRAILVAAAPGASFDAPQTLSGPAENTAVAVGAGRIVVAYHNERGVYARTGEVGSPLRAPQLLTAQHASALCAAIDDAGHATVAFARPGKKNLANALLVARARPGERFAAPITLSRVFAGAPRAAAAGTTTALIWHRRYSDDARVRVAIARGSGRFQAPETPSAPGLGPMGVRGQPYAPVVAVGRAGDVLLAYAYGYEGAVHAAVRRIGRPRFGPLHVVSELGEGGWPSAALLSDRRPLIVYAGRRREILAATSLTGPAPDLIGPRVEIKLSSNAVDELRASNTLRVRIRCSKPCMLQSYASLRTKDGNSVADGVDRKVLRSGATFTESFAFGPNGRAGRPRHGARVRVTIDAHNSSGTSTEVVKKLTL
jgi:hypothetical protein